MFFESVRKIAVVGKATFAGDFRDVCGIVGKQTDRVGEPHFFDIFRRTCTGNLLKNVKKTSRAQVCPCRKSIRGQFLGKIIFDI